MALKKAKNLSNGSSGEYWKITSIEVDRKNLSASFLIYLYKNKSVSDAGNPSLGPNHSFTGVFTKEELSGDITELGYDFIKESVAGARPAGLFDIISPPMKAWDDLHGAADV